VEEGEGPAVLFFHFGLGDLRVFEPEVRPLADAFRCIAYDRRFFRRTEAPDEPYAPVGDAIALLDALDVERAARNPWQPPKYGKEESPTEVARRARFTCKSGVTPILAPHRIGVDRCWVLL
jgi:hypothetical protein